MNGYELMTDTWDDSFMEAMSQRWPDLDPVVILLAFEQMKAEMEAAK